MGDRTKAPERELFTLLDQWKSTLVDGIVTPSTAISPPTLDALLNCILIRLLWLKLLENQGNLPHGTILSCSEADAPQDQFYQLFQGIVQRSMAPSFHSPPLKVHVKHHAVPPSQTRDTPSASTLQFASTTVKEILSSLHAFTNPALASGPSDILGLAYEHFLNHPIAPMHPASHPPAPAPHSKKARGIYYTPAAIVEKMVEQTLGEYLKGKAVDAIANLTILDPACGSGAFLVQAYKFLLTWYQQQMSPSGHSSASLPWETKQMLLRRHIYGVDVDPQAVEITGLSLLFTLLEGFDLTLHSPGQTATQHGQQSQSTHIPEINIPTANIPADHVPAPKILTANIQWGNAVIGPDLIHDPTLRLTSAQHHPIRPLDWHKAFPKILQRGGFDIVLGNPPYVDAEWMTRYQPIERHYCSQHYRTASGNWDLFCVFCEKALQVCQPYGLTSFIVPNKLGAASYARSLRHLLSIDNQLLALRDYSDVPVFPIAVYPLVYVVRKTKPTATPVKWEKVTRSTVDMRFLDY
ncbi:MAG: N-6 DNA methylase, partial [Symploca sp. SIO2B6]|nr:N-6 DNA methylase [Symploca sp. SIO2B6]